MDSEFPTESADAPDNRPLVERIVDKNWKKRQQAYEDLKKIIGNDENPSVFPTFVEILPKMIADINANNMELAVDVVTIFADKAPVGFMGRYSETIFPVVVDKTFGPKPTILMKGQQLLLKLMEVDEPTSCALYLVSRLGDKKPKVPAASIEVIREGISSFGVKTFPVKDILNALGPAFEATNADTRDMAMTLLIELYKWVGKATAKIVDGLRDAQKVTFEQQSSALSGQKAPVPTLYLRKDRKSAQSAPPEPDAGGGGGGGSSSRRKSASGPADSGDDGREYVDDVDLMKKLKGTDYATLVQAEKWDEQQRALQLVIDAIGLTPKLKKGTDVGDVVSACKNFLRAGHVNVQTNAIKVLSLLADGLRNEFAPTAKAMNDTIIQKYKEKKLIPECHSYLVQVLKYSVELSSMLDSLSENVKSKKNPPHARIGLLDFILTVLTDQPGKVSGDQMKTIADILIDSAEDPDPKVRDVCASCLTSLAILVKSKGKSAADAFKMLAALETSSPRVYAKIKPAMLGEVVAPPAASEGAPKRAVSSKPPIFKKKAVEAPPEEEPAPVKADTKMPGAAKKAGGSVGSGVTKSASVDDDGPEDLAIDGGAAQDLLAELAIPGWDDAIQTQMESAKWQDKVEAMEAIGKAVEASQEGGKYSAALIRFIGTKTGGFKINNVSILKSAIQLFTTAAKNVGSSPFSKGAVWEVIKNLLEKMSDKKAAEGIIEMLIAFCAATTPSYVFKRCKAALAESKSPAVHENLLVWLKAAITEFGATRFPIAMIGGLCHEELENKVAGVRTAAIEVFGALYHQLGPKVQSVALTDSIKPQVKASIEAEFQKVGYDASAAVAATRRLSIKSEAGGGDGGGGLARLDLAKELGGASFLTELSMTDGKTSWQNRKTAMETLIGTCERSGFFIENNKFVAEVCKALKERMDDSQANNKPIAANAIGHLLASIEPEAAAKLVKSHAGSGLIGGFADIKKSMRDAVVTALDMAVTQNKGGKTADPAIMVMFVPHITDIFKNPVGRLELLTWIMSHSYSVKTDAVSEWMTPLVVVLQDKVAAVRTLAEALLMDISGRALISKLHIEKGFRDLPASTMRSLQASYQKIMQAYGTLKEVIKKPASLASNDSHQDEDDSASVIMTVVGLPNEGEDDDSAFQFSEGGASVGGGGSAVGARPGLSRRNDSSKKIVIPEEPSIPSGDKFFLKRIMKSAKLKRLEDFAKTRWPESPGENELQALHEAWDPFLSYELSAALFPIVSKKTGPPSQDILVGGIIGLLAQLESPLFLQHTDFVFRWCSYALALRETPVTLLKILQLLIAVFDKMRSEGSQMHDSEIASIIPQIIMCSGHNSERHKAAFKQAISSASEVIAPTKLCQQLVNGLECVNKKSRVVCLEELQRVVEGVGAGSLGRTGVKDIGAFLDKKDVDQAGRSACLDLLYSIYVSLGQDMPKLAKLLGNSVSQTSLYLMEERIKQKNKLGGATAARNALLTPPADRYDKDNAPFQLNLSNNSVKRRDDDDLESVATLDIVSPNVNAYAEVVSALNDDDIDGIFVDIVRKIDALIAFDVNNKKVGNVAAAYTKVHEDAKDYIKMLQSNIKGTWHKNEESMREDMEIISKQANPLTRRICLCITHAFSPPVTFDPDGIAFDIDTTLAAAALSSLYAFVEKPMFVQRYTVHTMTEVIAVCARSLIDDRLYKPHSIASVNDANKLIVRGINLILLKFTESANTGLLFCALLRTFALCIPEVDRTNDTIDAGLLVSLGHESTKVVVRLFVRLLNMELKSPSPFSLPSVSVPRLMHALNDFFSCHPHHFEDDTPFCAAKTLVAQAVASLGAESLLKVMKAHNISQDNFLTKMVARLGGVELLAPPRTNLSDLVVPAAVNEALNTELGVIIDEITSAKDKDASIKKLYLFLRSHPEVDVQVYFQRVSITFRRFVLDNLARIEANSIADELVAARDKKPLVHRFYKLIQSNPHLDGNQILKSVPPELRRFILDQLAEIEAAALQLNGAGSNGSKDVADVPNAESSDSVALKILEGLKKRENLVPKVSDITKRRSSLTPHLDRVKGSLDALTSELNLSPANVSNPVAKGADEDADLATRLSRLKALGK